jgi:hypothetical protein
MELTGIWPPLPIILYGYNFDYDATMAYHNRICEININLRTWQLRHLASTMQVQFPALTYLRLQSGDPRGAPELPDGFLSGSVPHLQSLELHSVAFPGFPNLLLSVPCLVGLTFLNIPDSGYFSPETLATNLAVLTDLKSLIIKFRSPPTRPDPETRLPPQTSRTSLPALTRLELQVDSKYLEDLVARIDTPSLDSTSITFFHQLIFDVPQLARFMRRATRFQALNEAHVDFYCGLDCDRYAVQVGPLPQTRTFDDKSKLVIFYEELDGLLSSLVQVCTSFFPSIYTVESLYICGLPWEWHNDADVMQWLEIFHPFTAVKSLYLSEVFAQFIAFVLQGLVGERMTDVLPALEGLFVEDLQPSGPIQEAIVQFVAARQLLGHPVAVSCWDREAL